MAGNVSWELSAVDYGIVSGLTEKASWTVCRSLNLQHRPDVANLEPRGQTQPSDVLHLTGTKCLHSEYTDKCPGWRQGTYLQMNLFLLYSTWPASLIYIICLFPQDFWVCLPWVGSGEPLKDIKQGNSTASCTSYINPSGSRVEKL